MKSVAYDSYLEGKIEWKCDTAKFFIVIVAPCIL